MTFDVYPAIQEHAPNNTVTAAGDLHEAIWTDLLRRIDPRVHNVRVTRGDGGIDGVAFQDPATGEARVYQAKYFKDLNDDAGAHRAAIIDAFVRAHDHPFACTSWVLLLPRALSHVDLGWLMGTMKTDATAIATNPGRKLTQDRARVLKSIAVCAIEFRDGTDLVDLLSAHLDIAACHLPNSSLALAKELHDERLSRTRDRDELGLLLRSMNDEAIRAHQVDARRAKAALSILNQGWSNLVNMLRLTLVDEKLTRSTIEKISGEIERHAVDRAAHAYACEGLVPGASELIAEINYFSRAVQQVAMIEKIGMADHDSVAVLAGRIIERVELLQRRISDFWISSQLTAPRQQSEISE